MRDTAPAVSPSKDADGYALPDGLLVLVIDATKAEKAINADADRWRKLVPGGTFPPIACILSKTNTLAQERVDELSKWVRDNLSIKHVTPCAPSRSSVRRTYLDAEVMQVDPPQRLQRGLELDTYQRARGPRGAHRSHQEQRSHEHQDGARQRKQQSFAFTTDGSKVDQETMMKHTFERHVVG